MAIIGVKLRGSGLTDALVVLLLEYISQVWPYFNQGRCMNNFRMSVLVLLIAGISGGHLYGMHGFKRWAGTLRKVRTPRANIHPLLRVAYNNAVGSIPRFAIHVDSKMLDATMHNMFSRLSKNDLDELELRIKQVDFIYRVGDSYFRGSGLRSAANAMREQVSCMEKVLDANGIKHPKKKTGAWIEDVRKDLLALKPVEVKAAKADVSTMCDITGLDKALVLKVLTDRAQYSSPVMNAFAGGNDVSLDECKQAVAVSTDVDYFKGKLLKVNLSGNQFDARLFNREHGESAAQLAIAKLKEKQSDVG